MIDDAKWIQINQVAADWKEALSIACTPLIIHGAAEPNYLQGIIKNTQSWGALLFNCSGHCYATCTSGTRGYL